MAPLLSIVIPTRNRQHYLAIVIESILDIDSSNFELVVHDNSDKRELDPLLEKYRSDARLRYVYAPDSISSMDNFDLAFRQARGEYICTIGDDDFVNPEILKVCQWAKRNGVDAISDGRWGTQYFWPGYGTDNPNETAGGWLQIQAFSGRVEFLDPEAELRRCAVSGGMSLQRLPRPYLGIIRRSCLVQALDQIAHSPVGTCPDMFYAVAVASHMKRLCIFDYPLIIAGYSKAGAGHLIALKRHQGRVEDAPHLRARRSFVWPDLIPRFYSEYTFYAESALRGLQSTGRTDLIGQFNLPFLCLISLIKFPEYRPEVLRSMASTRQQKHLAMPGFVLYFLLGLLAAFWMLLEKRIASRNLRPGLSRIVRRIEDLNSSGQAMDALTEYLVANRHDCVERLPELSGLAGVDTGLAA